MARYKQQFHTNLYALRHAFMKLFIDFCVPAYIHAAYPYIRAHRALIKFDSERERLYTLYKMTPTHQQKFEASFKRPQQKKTKTRKPTQERAAQQKEEADIKQALAQEKLNNMITHIGKGKPAAVVQKEPEQIPLAGVNMYKRESIEHALMHMWRTHSSSRDVHAWYRKAMGASEFTTTAFLRALQDALYYDSHTDPYAVGSDLYNAWEKFYEKTFEEDKSKQLKKKKKKPKKPKKPAFTTSSSDLDDLQVHSVIARSDAGLCLLLSKVSGLVIKLLLEETEGVEMRTYSAGKLVSKVTKAAVEVTDLGLQDDTSVVLYQPLLGLNWYAAATTSSDVEEEDAEMDMQMDMIASSSDGKEGSNPSYVQEGSKYEGLIDPATAIDPYTMNTIQIAASKRGKQLAKAYSVKVVPVDKHVEVLSTLAACTPELYAILKQRMQQSSVSCVTENAIRRCEEIANTHEAPSTTTLTSDDELLKVVQQQGLPDDPSLRRAVLQALFDGWFAHSDARIAAKFVFFFQLPHIDEVGVDEVRLFHLTRLIFIHTHYATRPLSLQLDEGWQDYLYNSMILLSHTQPADNTEEEYAFDRELCLKHVAILCEIIVCLMAMISEEEDLQDLPATHTIALFFCQLAKEAMWEQFSANNSVHTDLMLMWLFFKYSGYLDRRNARCEANYEKSRRSKKNVLAQLRRMHSPKKKSPTKKKKKRKGLPATKVETKEETKEETNPEIYDKIKRLKAQVQSGDAPANAEITIRRHERMLRTAVPVALRANANATRDERLRKRKTRSSTSSSSEITGDDDEVADSSTQRKTRSSTSSEITGDDEGEGFEIVGERSHVVTPYYTQEARETLENMQRPGEPSSGTLIPVVGDGLCWFYAVLLYLWLLKGVHARTHTHTHAYRFRVSDLHRLQSRT